MFSGCAHILKILVVAGYIQFLIHISFNNLRILRIWAYVQHPFQHSHAPRNAQKDLISSIFYMIFVNNNNIYVEAKNEYNVSMLSNFGLVENVLNMYKNKAIPIRCDRQSDRRLYDQSLWAQLFPGVDGSTSKSDILVGVLFIIWNTKMYSPKYMLLSMWQCGVINNLFSPLPQYTRKQNLTI